MKKKNSPTNKKKSTKDFKPIATENDKVRHTVFAGLCKGCRICQQVCPVKCIGIDEDNRGIYNNKTVKCDVDKCISCGLCETNCPDRAIKVESKEGKKQKTKKPSPESTSTKSS